MALGGKVGRIGAPVPCSQCRIPFNSSLVGAGKRKRMSNMICPRCMGLEKAKKARKKAKKRSD